MTVEARPTAQGDPGGVDIAASEVPKTVRRTRRRRRPSGAAPPLPRHIGLTGKVWLITISAMFVWVVVLLSSEWARRVTDRADSAILREIAQLRTAWLTDAMDAVSEVGSGYAVTAVGVALLVALVVFRRWRHLFTFVGAIFVLLVIGDFLHYEYPRPRPYDVRIIGEWAGFSFEAPPVAILAIVVIGINYTLVPAGRARNTAKWVGGAIVLTFAAAQLYLATYHPSDVAFGLALTFAIFINAFRFFTPNEVFPVTYHRGKTAHLDVDGRRGEALRQAVQDQLGMTVLEVKPVGLAGSGGSTPLRLRVSGDPDTYLFGKLYAMNHVRADRWYKWGRILLYGRLEDEAPFQSVRRLVEYEDYALRLMRDAGIATATPYGIVEMTPEREYLLLTEFFDGAAEIGEAEVDDAVIDDGLLLIRHLWDAGLAHRDIKPANLLVKDHKVLLIDVAFMQLRPSPWRQAVDLANMMLVLAVRTDADRVYERALRVFTPDEIAEAFAAARGVASPTQLRAMMKQDGRDLVARFRALAPERRPISLQRWSPIRVAIAAVLIAGAVVVIPNTVQMLTPLDDIEVTEDPTCGTDNMMILMAQAVPSATSIPCVATLPAGWSIGGARVRSGAARFWLDSEIAGDDAVQATLRSRDECNIGGATEVPSDEEGLRRYERVEQLPPHLHSTRYYVFPGGCVTYQLVFEGPTTASLLFDADSALSFQPRKTLVRKVARNDDLKLCGAGAPC
jgi:tRNA A-37 threonylcarbamoyl transferase component Bud32